jgi:DNA-directed RNA polymerase sigma subunit (sigma70/sigma32)
MTLKGGAMAPPCFFLVPKTGGAMKNDEVLQLTEREMKVMRMLLGTDGRQYTLEEIAAHFNLARARIKQIRDHAIAKMRDE